MNAIIFGGESPRHEQWVQNVYLALEPHCDTVRQLHYLHWARGGAEIDLKTEIVRAGELAEDLDNYVVVAKSIGTVVTALATARGLLHPIRCVFLGFPLSLVERSLPEVSNALHDLPPTAFVHNEFDKVGSAESLSSYLNEVEMPQYSYDRVMGNHTHDYVDFEQIALLATG